MKKSLLILLALTIQLTIVAQNIPPLPTTKKTSGTKSEIDRLYEKYKNSDDESITLYTPFGELYGTLKINFNSSKKPESIIISGSTNNKEAVARFIADFIQQKLSANYSDPKCSFSTAWEYESIKSGLDVPQEFDMSPSFYFTKGNMYSKIKGYCSIRKTLVPTMTPIKSYEFEVETGDRSRLGGRNAKPFDF